MKRLIYPCLMMILNHGLYAEEQLYTVKFEVELQCPMSNELQELIDVIPKESNEKTVEEWNDWVASCVSNMEKVIEVIKSGNVGNSAFSVSALPEEQTN